MGKKLNQELVPVYSGMLFGDKKKWGTSKCYNTDEPRKHYFKSKKPAIKDHILYYFINMKCPKLGKLYRDEVD